MIPITLRRKMRRHVTKRAQNAFTVTHVSQTAGRQHIDKQFRHHYFVCGTQSLNSLESGSYTTILPPVILIAFCSGAPIFCVCGLTTKFRGTPACCAALYGPRRDPRRCCRRFAKRSRSHSIVTQLIGDRVAARHRDVRPHGNVSVPFSHSSRVIAALRPTRPPPDASRFRTDSPRLGANSNACAAAQDRT
jgi:hypothetical protein